MGLVCLRVSSDVTGCFLPPHLEKKIWGWTWRRKVWQAYSQLCKKEPSLDQLSCMQSYLEVRPCPSWVASFFVLLDTLLLAAHGDLHRCPPIREKEREKIHRKHPACTLFCPLTFSLSLSFCVCVSVSCAFCCLLQIGFQAPFYGATFFYGGLEHEKPGRPDKVRNAIDHGFPGCTLHACPLVTMPALL